MEQVRVLSECSGEWGVGMEEKEGEGEEGKDDEAIKVLPGERKKESELNRSIYIGTSYPPRYLFIGSLEENLGYI